VGTLRFAHPTKLQADNGADRVALKGDLPRIISALKWNWN